MIAIGGASSSASSSNSKKKSCHLKKCKHCGTKTGARAKLCPNEACKKPFDTLSKWAKYKRKARSQKKSWDEATKKQKAEFALKQLDLCLVCQEPVNYNPSTTICSTCNKKMCVECAMAFAKSQVRNAFPVYEDNPNLIPPEFGLWKTPCCRNKRTFPVINPVIKDDGTKPSLDANDPSQMKKRIKLKENSSLWDKMYKRSWKQRKYVKKRKKLWIRCQELNLIPTFPNDVPPHRQYDEILQMLAAPRGYTDLVVWMEKLLLDHGCESSAQSTTLHKIQLQEMRNSEFGLMDSIGMGSNTHRVHIGEYRGIYINEIVPNSPAARAHIKKDMIVTEMQVMKCHQQGGLKLSEFNVSSEDSNQVFFENLKSFIQNAVINFEADELWIYTQQVHVI